MAGKVMSGKYGSSRGTNYGAAQSGDKPGCFGVVALLILAGGALATLLANAAQYL